MNTFRTAFLVASLAAVTSATAADSSDAGLFAKGQKQFTVLGGTGYAFGEDYFVIGAGASYYVTDGLNLGLQLETWTGSDPGIFKVTPSVNYVFYQTPRISPYIGLFYRYTDVDNRSSYESIGSRFGAYLKMSNNSYAGFGGVYESYLDCDTRTNVSCDELYPEISFTLAF